jgi:hypothetical protein
MAEHMREGHQRGERVVAGAVQQNLLYVGAAQAGKRGLDAHPVRGRKRQFVDVLEPDRRQPGDERTLINPPADCRGRLAGKIVPEYQRLHADLPCRRSRYPPLAGTAEMSDAYTTVELR